MATPVTAKTVASGRVLIVEDDPSERESLAALVQQWGYEVQTAGSGEEALAAVEEVTPALVITDLMLPEMDGLALLERLRAVWPSPIVLVLTGHATIESAVVAMRQGVYDYLTKPVDVRRLHVLLEKGLEQESLSREVSLLRHELRQRGRFGRLLGQTKPMQEVYRWIELAATSSAPVLVYGESGTGKELVARTIHERSDRRAKPLVAINCAAIPETLIESELFGHERGAFTGATERRAGCFELSDGGTLFLDEIAEMAVSVQAKLLRVLQEGTFRRVGGKTELRVNVRVIAATNREPMEAIQKEQLREDLYYRLNVFTIRVPPLRERPEDVPLLAQTFIEELSRQDNRSVHGLTVEAEQALARYPWPGNVRQLQNVIHRAVVAASAGVIGVEHLPSEIVAPPAAAPAPTSATAEPPVTSLAEMERALIARVVRESGEDRVQAARILGISVRSLASKLTKLGLAS